MSPTREMTASNDALGHVEALAVHDLRSSTLPKPARRAVSAANARMLAEMSVATTSPVRSDAARCRERLTAGAGRDVEHPGPGPDPGHVEHRSVAAPSQSSSVRPQRFQASAAACHCSRVVLL